MTQKRNIIHNIREMVAKRSGVTRAPYIRTNIFFLNIIPGFFFLRLKHKFKKNYD